MPAGHASEKLFLDAHIAVLAIEGESEEFWTTDRSFVRFPDFRLRNRSVRRALFKNKGGARAGLKEIIFMSIDHREAQPKTRML